MSHAHRPAASRSLTVVLCLLTVFGPISMDLYLPVLPALTTDLHATTSAAQLTITACLLGLALGQVVAGPISDRFGRRLPLLAGVLAYIVTSALCAVSPTIPTLVAARFVQGLAGAAGIVIAQAAGRDLYRGSTLLRYYGRLTVIAGLAAIIGPVLGGQLAALTDWRGLFVFLAAIGVLILLACLAVFRETLPASHRTTGGLGQTGRDFRRLLSDRVLLGAVLVTGLVNAALFAYLSGATFVLQDIYGLSPQGYSFAFGLNSLGFMLFGFTAGRLCERWSEHGTLIAGLALCLAGAGGLLATAVLHLPVTAVIVSLFTMVAGVATTTPPTTSLALANYPGLAGTASSLLGLARFGLGALAAPLVGLGGSNDALPLGLVTVGATLLAALAYLVTIRNRTRHGTRISAFAMIFTLLTACGSAGQPNSPEASAMRIRVTIGQTNLDAGLLDNATARDFASLLPLTIHTKDLHGEEKYGPLPRPLAAGIGQSTHAAGDFGFWSPGTEIAVYYRDGEAVPKPGIVMIGRIDRLGDVLSQSEDAVDITFSAAT